MQASSASWQRVSCQQGGATGIYGCCPKLGSHGGRAQHGGSQGERVISDSMGQYLH